MTGANMHSTLTETEIRSAEGSPEKALKSPDPIAWIYHYTEDYMFVESISPAMQGWEALLQMTRTMTPLSSVSIIALRTEGTGNMPFKCSEATKVNGRPINEGANTNVRLVIIWHKEADGQWHVELKLLNAALTVAK